MKSVSTSGRKVHSSISVILPTTPSIPDKPDKGEDDLFRQIRGLIILGKFLGLIPCDGAFQRDFKRFRYRRNSIGTLISLCIFLILLICCVVAFIGLCRAGKQNAADLAWSAASWVFYMHGTYLYYYYLRYSEIFAQIFTEWVKPNFYFHLRDKTLSRDVGFLAGIVMTSAVLENCLLQLTEFPAFEPETLKNSNTTVLHEYFARSHNYWVDLIPYHSFWAIFVFLANKFTLYAWNFSDILIAVFSRAIYAKFKLLSEVAEKDIPSIPFDSLEPSKHHDGEAWTKVARDHSSICYILGECERFLSPLIFCSYAINIYFTCLQLLLGLSPSRNEVDPYNVKTKIYSIYATWSFIHLILRLYMVSISAANINVYAHQISRTLRRCPVIYYTGEVERIDRKVNTGPDIGLTGLGCFTITKPFILSIIGVVFTFEIVLLQASPALPSCGSGSGNTEISCENSAQGVKAS